MAQGERRWSTEGRAAKKYTFPLLTPGEYELKLLGAEAKVAKKPEPGKMPYVATSYEVLNSATKEGGRNQRIFQNMFTSLKVGKDGSVMPERADQINGLTKAVGEDADFGVVQHPDENDQPQDCLSAEEIKDWLVAHDGLVVTARLKIEKGSGGYADKNAIDYFVVEAGAATGTTTSASAPAQADLFEDTTDDYARSGKPTANGALPPPPPPPKSTGKVTRR